MLLLLNINTYKTWEFQLLCLHYPGRYDMEERSNHQQPSGSKAEATGLSDTRVFNFHYEATPKLGMFINVTSIPFTILILFHITYFPAQCRRKNSGF